MPAVVPPWARWAFAGFGVWLLVMLAIWLGAWALYRQHEKDMRLQWVQQQSVQADLWVRMLTARMEAHQRLLASVAQGMHSSLLDKPAVLDALMQQDGSTMRLFESLHVALPNGSITHHGVGNVRVDLDSQGRDALRKTLADGKPSVVHVMSAEDVHHLRALLAVPMRHADGQVSGTLAAMVKLPLASLMPVVDAQARDVQYMLLDASGLVLAHSDGLQRWRQVQELWGGAVTSSFGLTEPLVAHAETRIVDQHVVSRVGLPLPQWQAVIVRDLHWQQVAASMLPWQLWGAWVLGAMGLATLALCVLWRTLLVAPARRIDRTDKALAVEQVLAENTAEMALPHHAASMAMFEAVAATLWLEQGGWIKLASPQVLSVLGYGVVQGEAQPFAQWLADPNALAHMRYILMDAGTYEGVLAMRKKDGDVVLVEALGWVPAPLPDATLWRIRLPWRQRKAMPLPDQEHVWHDSLTGLPNRDAFMWGLQSWVTESVHPAKTEVERVPAQGCFMFVDIDHLGMINESISREMGNKVLRHVGRLIATYTQPLGDVARLGGDEFAVLLPGISLVHAQAIGQALCDAVWRWQPSWGGERYWVSLSIGIVPMDAQRHSPEQALRAADMACYEAKRRGRCQVAVAQISAQAAVMG